MVWIMVIVSEVVICARLFVDSTPSDLDDKAHAVAVSIYTRSRCVLLNLVFQGFDRASHSYIVTGTAQGLLSWWNSPPDR